MTGNIDQDFMRMPPITRDLRFRVEMTVACRDCDGIPKHPDAGKVIVEDGQRIQIMHNGVRVLASAYGEAWTEEIIARLRGHHEPQEELVFYEILKRLPPKATMIELGGNWSYYSLWFLSEAPTDRRSIVVEPDPNYLSAGRRNAVLNGYEIEFIQASVGECRSGGQPFQTETGGLLTLPQITVAELFGTFAIDHLDVLHCDAQGAELAVIRSSLELLRQGRISYAVFSTHAHPISGDPLTHQRCLSLLESTGASIVAEHDVHESCSGDGLIVACCGSEANSSPQVRVTHNRYGTSLFRNPIFDLREALSASGRSAHRLADEQRHRNLLEIEVAETRQTVKVQQEKLDELRADRDEVKTEVDRLEADRDALKAELETRNDEREALRAALANAQEEVREKTAQVDRWWASADRALRELMKLKSSWSWRLTRPVRAVARTGRSIRKFARFITGFEPFAGSTGPTTGYWRRHPLSRHEIKRFMERQRSSIRKRVRRLRGVPPDVSISPALTIGGAAAPATPCDLSEEAKLILARLERQRASAAGRHRSRYGRR